MKIKVEVLKDVYQEQAKKGDVGYIAGYTNWGTNNIPVCIVVFKDFISLVPHK